jgi:pimeloyl-ACP methyl ester carboxylesterase
MYSEPVTLYTSSRGNPENPAIIFIHGFPYDSSMWDSQIEFLSNDFYCIVYDVRGLGKSPVGDGQSIMDIFAEDLFSVMAQYNLKQPAVCGFSMGGYIIMNALSKKPDAFSRVILCNTKSESDGDEARLKRNAAIMKINTESTVSFVTGFIEATFSDSTKRNNPEIVKKMIDKASAYDPKGVKGAIIALMSRTDSSAVLSQLKYPALVIAGKEDNLMPVSVAQAMASNIPDCEFRVIEKAAHMAPVEASQAVNQAIWDFLKKK